MSYKHTKTRWYYIHLYPTVLGIDADDNVDSLRQKLHEVTDDRDKLRDRCQQLESELLKYGDLPGEVEILQQRSKTLDSVISERDSLYLRLKELEGIEEEVKELKAKADRADELERQLAQLKQDMQRERRSSDAQARGDVGGFSFVNEGKKGENCRGCRFEEQGEGG